MDMQSIKQLIYKGEKIDVECKKAENTIPRSAYESYSAFANTKGGHIVLGVYEDKKKKAPEERFIIQGIENPARQLEDFWNTINGNKVNVNILKDEDVFIVEENDVSLIVIHVPRADYKQRPVYVGENPYKGTYKRNHEGDYHATEDEVRAMLRDQNPDGNDSLVLGYYSIDDIDLETLKHYRKMFQTRNPEHIWNSYEDKEFLEALGGYRKDRRTGTEGLTLAGLMMFGKGLAVRDEFDNVFMDYRDESQITSEIRWNDRVTYDGTWENNLFNFFTKVISKLTVDLKKPFVLENQQRVDDTPVHKAIREAFVNLIIHADYLLDAGTLKIIKTSDGFSFTNPGILKLPKEEIFKGGNSKPRNPRMQTMLRMVGFGDNAGSGFPTILAVWRDSGWVEPELIEDTVLNQVTLKLRTVSVLDTVMKSMFEQLSQIPAFSKNEIEKLINILKDNQISSTNVSPDNWINTAEILYDRLSDIADNSKDDIEKALDVITQKISEIVALSGGSNKFAKELADILAESAEKSAESAEKLSDRQKQILSIMKTGVEYSADDIAQLLDLKGSRTRQLLNELVKMGAITGTTATKKRRYIKLKH
ncbi:MAG: putative DNA binding domain-containing protein [Lachnospiraceae bacterium]|nr:putative DNA binding domain-containing protein [Lachnospiraceae bacterium]